MSLEKLLNKTPKYYNVLSKGIKNNFNFPIGFMNAFAMSSAVGVSQYYFFDSDISQSVDVAINQMIPSFVLGGISSKIVQNLSENKMFDTNVLLGYTTAVSPAIASNVVGSYIFQNFGIPQYNPEPFQAALSVGGISSFGLSVLTAYERNKDFPRTLLNNIKNVIGLRSDNF